MSPFLFPIIAFLCFGICTAQESESDSTSTSSAPVTTHTVSVGAEGLFFTPNQLSANVSDVIEFRFYPQNHSVARAEYGRPCIPYEVTGINKQGFWSGFHPISVVLNDPPKFQVVVNDTNPIFFYCSAPAACIDDHMIGVINPNETETFDNQLSFAQNSSIQFSPGENFPVEALPSSATTTTTTSTSQPATATSVPTSTTPSPIIINSNSSPNSNHLTPGAIAGIAIGTAALVLLAAALLYLCGRQRTIKEITHQNSRPPPPSHPLSTTSYMQASLSDTTYPYKSPRHDIHGLGGFSPHAPGSNTESASYRSRSPPPDENFIIPPLNVAHQPGSRSRSPSYQQGTPRMQGLGSPGFPIDTGGRYDPPRNPNFNPNHNPPTTTNNQTHYPSGPHELPVGSHSEYYGQRDIGAQRGFGAQRDNGAQQEIEGRRDDRNQYHDSEMDRDTYTDTTLSDGDEADEADEESFYWEDSPILGNGGEGRRGTHV